MHASELVTNRTSTQGVGYACPENEDNGKRPENEPIEQEKRPIESGLIHGFQIIPGPRLGLSLPLTLLYIWPSQ